MKKRMLLSIILGVLMLFIFSGCKMYYGMDTKIKADESGTFVVTTGYTEESLQEMIEGDLTTEEEVEELKKDAKIIKRDGERFYCTTKKVKFSNIEKLQEALLEEGRISYVSGDTFHIKTNTVTEENIENNTEDSYDVTYIMELKVTFDKPICKSIGGTLSNNNKTITWDFDEWMEYENLYATTSKKTTKASSVNIKKDKIYKKTQTVKVKSGVGNVYLDEIPITSGKMKAENGIHTIGIMNQNGTKKYFSFIVDTEKPIIEGAENNKTYKKKVELTFYDNESGVKKVTINGKKISAKSLENGYTIKKNGKYTVKVTDKAGHTKTIKFTIKK